MEIKDLINIENESERISNSTTFSTKTNAYLKRILGR